MKRQKKKPRHPTVKQASRSANAPANGSPPIRRTIIGRLRTWGLLALALAAGVWYLAAEVTATITEHDLSRIGNGVPAVVQIHDPRCSSCVALQKETREAMKEFDRGELQYLVADINNPDGRNLASAHGVGNVTLLLFDGEGKRRRTLAGPNTSDLLVHYFRSHRNSYRTKP